RAVGGAPDRSGSDRAAARADAGAQHGADGGGDRPQRARAPVAVGDADGGGARADGRLHQHLARAVATFKFSTPIGVRYSDLDAQGHLNHARYFTFMEEARFRYVQALGLWRDLHDFNAVGQIVAEAGCTYLRPVFLGQTVDVAVRI